MNVKHLKGYILIFLVFLCNTTLSFPNLENSFRKREDLSTISRLQFLASEVPSDDIQLSRHKRKLPDAHFGAKNAVVGFIFGKIDNIIDSKTRFIDALDRSNIEKNQAYNISVPRPINDFQGLVTAVVSPKISSLTNVLSGLTTGVLGGIGSLSGNGQNDPNIAAQQGVGNIVQKFFSLSGPILQSSGGNTGGGKILPTTSPDESGY